MCDRNSRNAVKCVRNEAVSRKSIFQRFKRFRVGCKSVDCKHHCGIPVTSKMMTNDDRVRQLLLQGHHLSIRIMRDKLNFSCESVRTIETEDFGKCKLCSTFVHRHISDGKKQQRVQSCCNFIDMADKDATCLH